MTDEFVSSIESEDLVHFLARPEITPEVYAALRNLHRSGRTPDELSHRIWNLVRNFQPTVHVGRIREQILNRPHFPDNTWAEVKAALVHLEAGVREFATHGARRLILRPRRERLEAALRASPTPPALLAKRAEAALAAAT